jgi:hypothetical protein
MKALAWIHHLCSDERQYHNNNNNSSNSNNNNNNTAQRNTNNTNKRCGPSRLEGAWFDDFTVTGRLRRPCGAGGIHVFHNFTVPGRGRMGGAGGESACDHHHKYVPPKRGGAEARGAGREGRVLSVVLDDAHTFPCCDNPQNIYYLGVGRARTRLGSHPYLALRTVCSIFFRVDPLA